MNGFPFPNWLYESAAKLIEWRFRDLPEVVRPYAAYDAVLNPFRNGHISFADLYRKTRPLVCLSVFGGTKLEEGVPVSQRRYYHLNRALAKLMVKQPLPRGGCGWSFVTGQGPGKAMAGPHYCLRQERESVIDCKSVNIGVPSRLADEPPHQFADPGWITAPQGDIMMREMMIISAGDDASVLYAGHIGSRAEFGISNLTNYVAGRMPVSFPKRPLIVVDQPDEPERGLVFEGGSFYAPFKALYNNAVTMNLAKNEDPSIHWLDVTDPLCAARIIRIVREHLAKTEGLPFDINEEPDLRVLAA